jgi:AcrR family transcriptional regulator
VGRGPHGAGLDARDVYQRAELRHESGRRRGQQELRQAAWELFRERGYDRTTVEEIAARAGLTERTFFRYYADKREVLFWGSQVLEKSIVDAIAAAPEGTAPLDAVAAAMENAGRFIQEQRSLEQVRRRRSLIAAHEELREREVMKYASLASAVTAALHRRGVVEPNASLIAEMGLAIFKVGFERWAEDAKRKDLVHHIRDALSNLKAVMVGGGNPRARRRRSRPVSAPR